MGKATTGSLATAIEKYGIYTWDRYGRFVLANEEYKNRALDIVSEYSSVEGIAKSYDLEEGQDDNSILFGWAKAVCPDFESLETLVLDQPIRKCSESNSRKTLLVLIAALAKEANIDFDEKGSARKIMELTQNIGAHISDETIRNLKTEIADAVESRMK